MGTVPTGPLAALYSNTTPGIVADPAVVDAAIQIIVQTINDNWSSFQSFIQAPTLGVADGAVTSAKLRDGAVTKTKIIKEAVTQFTYDFMQIDQKIAELVVGNIPQSVIDAIAAEASARADVVQEHLDEHEVEFRNHEADYIRQPAFSITSGTSAEYSVTLNPAPTEIPEGFGITIVPHEQNGANPTLTIGNLTPIYLKDQKGNVLSAGKLLAGKPYSFRKVGTDFLADSGSGAEGDATANDLRAGKTATVESGELITGTLVTRATGNTSVTPSGNAQTLQSGIYGGSITIQPGKRFARGTSTANSNGNFDVVGLAFQPSVIIWSSSSYANTYGYLMNEYVIDLRTGILNRSLTYRTGNFYFDRGNINSSGATMLYNGGVNGDVIKWLAFE